MMWMFIFALVLVAALLLWLKDWAYHQCCPHCRESIRLDATVCPFCRREVSEEGGR